MVILRQKGLSFEIKNIKALYCEGDDINLDNDYTYEAFDVVFRINNQIIKDISKEYELCEGNIVYLLDSIDKYLIDKQYKEIEFIEPNFSFELKSYANELYNCFIIWCHDNSFNGGDYGDTAIGLRFVLEDVDLINFLERLRYEFNHKRRLSYKDYKEE